MRGKMNMLFIVTAFSLHLLSWALWAMHRYVSIWETRVGALNTADWTLRKYKVHTKVSHWRTQFCFFFGRINSILGMQIRLILFRSYLVRTRYLHSSNHLGQLFNLIDLNLFDVFWPAQSGISFALFSYWELYFSCRHSCIHFRIWYRKNLFATTQFAQFAHSNRSRINVFNVWIYFAVLQWSCTLYPMDRHHLHAEWSWRRWIFHSNWWTWITMSVSI